MSCSDAKISGSCFFLCIFTVRLIFLLHRLLSSRPKIIIIKKNPPLFSLSFQDPAGIFELVELVGNGTYGQVYKVRLTHKEDVSARRSASLIAHSAVLSAFVHCFRGACGIKSGKVRCE